MAGQGPEHGHGYGYGDRHHSAYDDRHHSGSDGRECSNHDGAYAVGSVCHSPGVLSGNLIQVVVSIPINICGNRIG
ncbi:chaplin [Streptomyces sp. NPDC058301]|uniref:chaplin n=1 Tax=Streptomyces sp. NPDC058301 TaxID=3346436 RepID=UPI0036EE958D